MSFLTNQSVGNIPIVHNYEYATLAAAQAATWSAGDVGKVFRITNEPNYYIIETSGGAFRQIRTEQVNTVETIDATETSCGTYSTATDFCYVVKSTYIGTVDTGGNCNAYEAKATFKNDSGTLTQVGGTTITVTDEDDATWGTPDIDANGTDIRIRVVGKAATDINWITFSEVKVFANGA